MAAPVQLEAIQADVDERNRATSAAEVAWIHGTRPDVFTAYVSMDGRTITTWTSEHLGYFRLIGDVHHMPCPYRRNRWRTIHATLPDGTKYYGRYYFDAQQCVTLRKSKTRHNAHTAHQMPVAARKAV